MSRTKMSAGRPSRGGKGLSIADVSEKKTKRLNAEIDAELHRRLKLHAVEQDKTITDLLVEICEEYLRKHS